MSPDPADGAPGVPGYVLFEQVAASGTVEVYRARDLSLGHEVAIKLLRPGLVNPEGTRRFIDGVGIMASLEHPGIPSVHAVGELPGGRPFAVLGLILGVTLDTLLRGRPDPRSDLARFVGVFRRVCDAVGFAHSQFVVHRNLKPRNVMVGEAFGEAQIISWSLAAVRVPQTQEELRRYPPRPGAVMGTPAYMSPEQARGQQPDERSDVFGLGGILCEILTDGPPFRGDTTLELVQASAAGDLGDAFARLDACGADAELVALCKRCLAPRPEDRPADGNAVAELVARISP